jgi:hypothetical protein
MRRMMLMALGLGLLGAAVGCQHTAGVCDCDRPVRGCANAEPPIAPVAAAAPSPMLHAEPIQTAPKVVDK